MRHGFANKKLNRTSEHRKALIKNMLNSLIKYEQIKTTLPKAKVLKPQADKIVTLGKKDSLHNTKILISKLQDTKSAKKVKKTFSDFRSILDLQEFFKNRALTFEISLADFYNVLNELFQMAKNIFFLKNNPNFRSYFKSLSEAAVSSS